MKLPFQKTIFLLFFSCLDMICLKSEGQKNDFSFPPFDKITTSQGLSYNMASSVMQDRRGFIWIATNYGLNRYDGYNFKVYNYDPADTNSISPGWYNSMIEDKKGIIWLSSSSQGFFSFDPVKEKFIHYYHQPGNPNSLSGDIHDGNMVEDSSGILWISTVAGLNSFDPVKKKFELFTHQKNDNSSLSSSRILWVCADEQNNIWAITAANTVDVFNISTKKVSAHFTIGSSQMPGNKNQAGFYIISKGQNGNIWIGSKYNGLYGYNTRYKTWKHLANQPGNDHSLKNNDINCIYENTDGSFFIATSDRGLYYYEPSTGKFYYSEVDGTIYSMAKDKSGKLWLACGDDGVLTMNPSLKKIVNINLLSKNTYHRSNLITGFFHAGQDQLYICGAKGVYIYDRESKQLKPFEIFEEGKNIFESTITWTIKQDDKNILWFCTLNGLVKFDPTTKQHSVYKHDDSDPGSIAAESATNIVFDKSGKHWVSTFGGGLNLFDEKTGKFKKYLVDDGKNSINAAYINGMFRDSKGLIYIGTWYGGLIQFNPVTGTFRAFRHRPADTNSIGSDITWPLYEDKNGFIWIGTVGGGLNVFDPSTGKFRSFTTQDGLPSNAVISMITDEQERTWIGTYHGLATCVLPSAPLDKNCKINFRNYDMSDGLPSNDINFVNAHKEPDGTLFFPTINAGFFYLKPLEFKDNDFVAPIYITGFKLLNKSVIANDPEGVLQSPVEFTNEINLNYKQNNFSFSFAALNYIHPEKNKYAYKLEGYDKDWIYTDASKRFASYTNLDPKKYFFKVKASNSDGIWNETPAELTIIITPPFWQTAWFKILVIVIVMSLLYVFYRYRIGQILLLQRIRNKIAADLHDDIGSTLNSISVFSEVARKDNSKRDHAMLMIGESSRKIVDSMSDIVWSINPENDSFDKIIFRMRSHSYNLLKAKKIECSFSADESLSGIKLPMDIRRNFYLIFKEALNNLVKYSQAAHASVLLSREHGSISFVIRDDGVGFDPTQEYSGNGLANMKKRAKEIDADLYIESVIDKGTTIELNLRT